MNPHQNLQRNSNTLFSKFPAPRVRLPWDDSGANTAPEHRQRFLEHDLVPESQCRSLLTHSRRGLFFFLPDFHNPNSPPQFQILDTFWPTEINQELSYGDFSVSLIKQFDLTHCIERSLRVTMLGSDVILNVSLLQNKLWPKQSAEYILGIAQNVIAAYRQQNQEQKQPLKPLIVNCLNGSDRSSLLAVAIAAILATQTKKPVLISKNQ